MFCKSRDVHFINNGPGRRMARRAIIFPIVFARIHYDAFHRRCGRDSNAAPVGVNESIRCIKAKSVRRIGWAVGAISINLPAAGVRYELMPVVIGPIERNYFRRLRLISAVEKQELHRRRVARKNAEINTAIAEGSSERRAAAGGEEGIHAARRSVRTEAAGAIGPWSNATSRAFGPPIPRNQIAGRAVVTLPLLRFPLQFRKNPLRQYFPQLNPPLIKRIDVPDDALRKRNVLVKGAQLPQR